MAHGPVRVERRVVIFVWVWFWGGRGEEGG